MILYNLFVMYDTSSKLNCHCIEICSHVSRCLTFNNSYIS